MLTVHPVEEWVPRVKDAAGQSKQTHVLFNNCYANYGATNALMRRGLRQVDFPIGSELVVEGFRAKNGSPTANGRSVTFADGRNFFLGATDAPQGSRVPGK